MPFFRGMLTIRKGKRMKTVTGAYSTAKIFTDNVEQYALAQIQMICDNEVSEGAKISVMPDVHPGKVGPVGLSMTVGKRILPNLIGVDMGCGMSMMRIKEKRVEGQKLDTIIRENIPAGSGIRREPHYLGEEFDYSRLACHRHINERKAACGLGTLGGGNHFIEVDKDDEGELYVIVHSGSRYLGVEVTEFYLKEGQKYLKDLELQVPYEMTWLEETLMQDYLQDLMVVQEYAELNREIILNQLVKGMKWKVQEFQSCVHNYVEEEEQGLMLRKGAISAKVGENVIIPINMRDGVILGKGLGKEEWNRSAPHGSGRILKRSDVAGEFTVSGFKKSMAGIYCSCIGKDTLDESPFAYRGVEEIAEAIKNTVAIEKIIRPIYNFKAGNR